MSVIMPCYNGQKFIGQSIESVIKQSYKNWELIIVDDCSTDNSFEIVSAYTKACSRIKLIRNKVNSGVAETRNSGIRIASGDFLAFLDSDDLWDPQKIEVQLAFMTTYDHPISHTAYRKIDEIGNVIAAKIPVNTQGVSYNQLLRHNEIGCLTAMYNVKQLGKQYFLKIGHEDFAYWLHLLKSEQKSYGINQVLGSYRLHGKSVSSNKLVAAKYTWKIYRDIEKLSLSKSIFYFCSYAIKSTLKYMKR